MILSRVISPVWVSLLALGLSACSHECVSTNFAPYEGAKAKTLGNVEISRVGAMVQENLSHARATLENKSSQGSAVNYHFAWSTADGFPAGENTPWVPVSIGPKFTQVIQSIAPNPQATSFQLQVCKIK